jgi:hypothetical protein
MQSSRAWVETAPIWEPTCMTCHNYFHQLGFAFEHYDATGAFRLQDQGQPVDARGRLDLATAVLDFSDALDLSRQLAAAPEVRTCVARQFVRWMLRRREVSRDEALLAPLVTEWAQSNFDLRELLVALSRSHLITHRSPSVTEVKP